MSKGLNEQSTEDTILQDNETVEDLILRQEQKEGLVNAINQLEPINKDIFLLRYIKDHSIEEIATQLDLSTTAVYARLSRGRIKLKKIMEGYHE